MTQVKGKMEDAMRYVWRSLGFFVVFVHVTLPLQVGGLLYATVTNPEYSDLLFGSFLLYILGSMSSIILDECPLTILQKWCMQRGGKIVYEGSFIAHVAARFGVALSERHVVFISLILLLGQLLLMLFVAFTLVSDA